MTLIMEGGTYWRRFQRILQRKFREWHERYFDKDESQDRIPYERPIKLVVPGTPGDLWDSQKCVKDSPLMTVEEWALKWGHEKMLY